MGDYIRFLALGTVADMLQGGGNVETAVEDGAVLCNACVVAPAGGEDVAIVAMRGEVVDHVGGLEGEGVDGVLWV